MGMTYGAAHHNEYGTVSGGKPGDQKQSSTPDYNGEVSLQDSVDSRSYWVYRPINADYATKMAQLMITACNNANIGYDQNRRTGVWDHGVDSTVATDADCSSLVSYCIYKATGKNLGAFSTDDEPGALDRSGLFNKVGTYSSGMTMYNGDVLVTKSSGHTLMCVKGNPRSGSDTELGGSISDGGAYDSSSGAAVAKENIDTSVIDQYILTIDRNTPNPDYKTMKKNRVSGVIIEAGYLYNAQHTIVSNPRNPYIQQQCKNAVSNEMPYGLYWDVKSRTVDEAKAELYQLQFLIRKYPPILGMWLHLAFTGSKSTNNKIIDTYYQEFEILGLVGNCGFYVTKSELEKIDWDTYQEKWWLWIVNHVSDTSELNALLEPYFFTISGEPGSAAANPDYNSGTVTASTGTTVSSGTLSNSTGAHITIKQQNGYYLDADHSSSGRLVIGDSRMVQLYAYNNYQYFSNASFTAVWAGHYWDNATPKTNTSARIATMKNYINKSVSSKGSCRVFLESTVNDYNGGSSYQTYADAVITLAKDLKSTNSKATVYVMSLIGGKGKNVSSFNTYLKNKASSNGYTFLDISGCLGGSNGGYLSDNIHFNDTTLGNIWKKIA